MVLRISIKKTEKLTDSHAILRKTGIKLLHGLLAEQKSGNLFWIDASPNLDRKSFGQSIPIGISPNKLITQ